MATDTPNQSCAPIINTTTSIINPTPTPSKKKFLFVFCFKLSNTALYHSPWYLAYLALSYFSRAYDFTDTTLDTESANCPVHLFDVLASFSWIGANFLNHIAAATIYIMINTTMPTTNSGAFGIITIIIINMSKATGKIFQKNSSISRSYAPTNLFVCDTNDPENLSEWNCIDCAVTVSNALQLRSYIALISIFHTHHILSGPSTKLLSNATATSSIALGIKAWYSSSPRIPSDTICIISASSSGVRMFLKNITIGVVIAPPIANPIYFFVAFKK